MSSRSAPRGLAPKPALPLALGLVQCLLGRALLGSLCLLRLVVGILLLGVVEEPVECLAAGWLLAETIWEAHSQPWP
jgi:hypothetical protein